MNEWKIIDEEFISYYGGTGHLISNGKCEFWLWHNKKESQKVCDMLNTLEFENYELKCTLALDAIDFIVANGKRINIPPYYEFENKEVKKYRRETYDEY